MKLLHSWQPCSRHVLAQDIKKGVQNGLRELISMQGKNSQTFDNSVENGAIIITFQAELDKISAGFRSFLGPQLNVNFPTGCS